MPNIVPNVPKLSPISFNLLPLKDKLQLSLLISVLEMFAGGEVKFLQNNEMLVRIFGLDDKRVHLFSYLARYPSQPKARGAGSGTTTRSHYLVYVHSVGLGERFFLEVFRSVRYILRGDVSRTFAASREDPATIALSSLGMLFPLEVDSAFYGAMGLS